MPLYHSNSSLVHEGATEKESKNSNDQDLLNLSVTEILVEMANRGIGCHVEDDRTVQYPRH